ncbi:MAG: non-canonical purine NTP pyrophosphatase [Nevskia sp.]|nr:non-canonical purine NTP pyrophosphatase [Nevskia sp.]
MILYAATSNPGKLRDFATAAAAHNITVLPLPGLQTIPAPPEDEPTFAGNARAKALYYSQHAPGLLVLADDSGLEVDSLDGAPGVRSARYADDQHFPSAPASTTDERNNACLLRALDGAPPNCRRARYRCVLAVARDGHVTHTAEGAVEGELLTAPRGTGGFGYDPLFFIPELQQTMAEISLETKHDLSHRGRAFRALLAQLAR